MKTNTSRKQINEENRRMSGRTEIQGKKRPQQDITETMRGVVASLLWSPGGVATGSIHETTKTHTYIHAKLNKPTQEKMPR